MNVYLLTDPGAMADDIREVVVAARTEAEARDLTVRQAADVMRGGGTCQDLTVFANVCWTDCELIATGATAGPDIILVARR